MYAGDGFIRLDVDSVVSYHSPMPYRLTTGIGLTTESWRASISLTRRPADLDVRGAVDEHVGLAGRGWKGYADGEVDAGGAPRVLLRNSLPLVLCDGLCRRAGNGSLTRPVRKTARHLS